MIGVAGALLGVAGCLSVLSYTTYPERVFFRPDGQAYPSIPGLRAFYESSETLRAQEFVFGALSQTPALHVSVVHTFTSSQSISITHSGGT